MASDYFKSIRFEGEPRAVLSVVESRLAGLGFKIIKRGSESMEAQGPGRLSSRRNPFLASPNICVRCEHRQLECRAQINTPRPMKLFVSIFPVSLTLGLTGVLAVIFSRTLSGDQWMGTVALVAGINLGMWLILPFFMFRAFERRARTALDQLLDGLATKSALPTSQAR